MPAAPSRVRSGPAPIAMLLHLVVSGFHAAVHQALDPTLRGRPVVVAVDGSPQAVCFACSVEARAAGLWPGMRVRSARQRCPGLVVCLPDGERYHRAQLALLDLLGRASPRVAGRPGRIDLDLAGTRRLWADRLGVADPVEQARLIANRAVAACARRLHLPVGVGGGERLLVARLAARLALEERGPVLLLTGAGAWARLDPLPVAWLPGLDRDARRRLVDCGLEHIGQLRVLAPDALGGLLGRPGEELAALLAGEREEPVPERVAPERRIACTAEADGAGFTPDEARQRLRALAAELGFRLRARGLGCCRLALALRWIDGREERRAAALPQPAAHDDELQGRAATLLGGGARRRVHCSRLRLEALGLVAGCEQGVLFDLAQRRRVEGVRDQVRRRFGAGSLEPGAIGGSPLRVEESC